MPTIDDARAEFLIANYIELHPRKSGLSNARLIQYGTQIWALIGWLEEDFSNADQVARDYAITREAMDAAIAFYERNKFLIDARIAITRGE